MHLILDNKTVKRFSDDTYGNLTIRFNDEAIFEQFAQEEAMDIRIPYLTNPDYANVYEECKIKTIDEIKMIITFKYKKYSYRTVSDVRKDKIKGII
jgi:hypothetical protein